MVSPGGSPLLWVNASTCLLEASVTTCDLRHLGEGSRQVPPPLFVPAPRPEAPAVDRSQVRGHPFGYGHDLAGSRKL
jgi:hypothetical protein